MFCLVYLFVSCFSFCFLVGLCASLIVFFVFLFVCMFVRWFGLLANACVLACVFCQGALRGRSLNEAVSTGGGGGRERPALDAEEARELQSRVLELEEQVRRRSTRDRSIDASIGPSMNLMESYNVVDLSRSTDIELINEQT